MPVCHPPRRRSPRRWWRASAFQQAAFTLRSLSSPLYHCLVDGGAPRHRACRAVSRRCSRRSRPSSTRSPMPSRCGSSAGCTGWCSPARRRSWPGGSPPQGAASPTTRATAPPRPRRSWPPASSTRRARRQARSGRADQRGGPVRGARRRLHRGAPHDGPPAAAPRGRRLGRPEPAVGPVALRVGRHDVGRPGGRRPLRRQLPPPVPGRVRAARARARRWPRRGCDRSPIDPTTDEGRLLLRSFVWPDQADRHVRLDAALDAAAEVPVVVDRADAADLGSAAARRARAPARPPSSSTRSCGQYLPGGDQGRGRPAPSRPPVPPRPPTPPWPGSGWSRPTTPPTPPSCASPAGRAAIG